MTCVAFASSDIAIELKSTKAPMGPAPIIEAAIADLTSEF